MPYFLSETGSKIEGGCRDLWFGVKGNKIVQKGCKVNELRKCNTIDPMDLRNHLSLVELRIQIGS